MTIALGKIVSSESHLLYHVRIFDASDCAAPPTPKDFAFGKFIAVENEGDLIVGIVGDTRLINPESSHYGPRLTIPHAQNAIFAPDYLNETGTEVTILLLGYLRGNQGEQGVPPFVLPVGTEIRTLGDEEIRNFHLNPSGQFQMRYYPLIRESGLSFSSSLALSICRELERYCGKKATRMLKVLRNYVTWQYTFSGAQSR